MGRQPRVFFADYDTTLKTLNLNIPSPENKYCTLLLLTFTKTMMLKTFKFLLYCYVTNKIDKMVDKDSVYEGRPFSNVWGDCWTRYNVDWWAL